MTPEHIKHDFFIYTICSICDKKIEKIYAKYDEKLKTKYACKEDCTNKRKLPEAQELSGTECE